MTVFVVLAAAGALLCLAAVLFDGVLDALELELGDGTVSLTSVSGAVAMFGLAGVVGVSGLDLSTAAASVVGAVVAVVTLVAVGLLVRSLRRTPPQTSQPVAGLRARVTTPAAVPGSFGEVHLVLDGTTVKRSAVSEAPLVYGQEVEVLAELSPTAVRVRPAARDRAGARHHSDPQT